MKRLILFALLILSTASYAQIGKVLKNMQHVSSDTMTIKRYGVTHGTFQGAIRDSGGQVYNVKAFGATGNGTTEDSTAIKAALVAGAGKTVYFPPGTYLCGAALSITTDRTTIYLDRGATIRLTSADRTLFAVSADYVVFAGRGTIDGNYALHTAEVYGINFLPGANGGTVDGLAIGNCAASAIYSYQVENLTVRNCTIDSCGGPGIVLYSVAGGLIEGNRLSYNTLWPSMAEQPSGVAAQVACSRVRIIGNDISVDEGTSNTSGITVNGTECTVANNVVRLTGNTLGISVALSKWVTVTGNTVTGGGASSIGGIEAANDTAVTIQGNAVKGNLNKGIALNSNNLAINVIGNVVDSCKLGIVFDGGGASVGHNTSNNIVTRCWNTGIYLNNTGPRSTISGNTIRPAAGGHGIANIGTDYLTITNNNIDSTSDAYGITFDANVTGCVVLGNVIAYSTYGRLNIVTGLGNLVAGATDNDTTFSATTNLAATDIKASGEFHKGTPGAMGSLKIKNIGQYTGIWVDTATTTPTVTNYSFMTDYSLAQTILNAPVNGSISLRVGNETETDVLLDQNGILHLGSDTAATQAYARNVGGSGGGESADSSVFATQYDISDMLNKVDSTIYLTPSDGRQQVNDSIAAVSAGTRALATPNIGAATGTSLAIGGATKDSALTTTSFHATGGAKINGRANIASFDSVKLANGTINTAPSFGPAGSPRSGFAFSGGQFFYSYLGQCQFALGASAFQVSSNVMFGWSSSTPDVAGMDAAISRGAAGKLYFGNGSVATDYSATLIGASIGLGTTTPYHQQSIRTTNSGGWVLYNSSVNTTGTSLAQEQDSAALFAAWNSSGYWDWIRSKNNGTRDTVAWMSDVRSWTPDTTSLSARIDDKLAKADFADSAAAHSLGAAGTTGQIAFWASDDSIGGRASDTTGLAAALALKLAKTEVGDSIQTHSIGVGTLSAGQTVRAGSADSIYSSASDTIGLAATYLSKTAVGDSINAHGIGVGTMSAGQTVRAGSADSIYSSASDTVGLAAALAAKAALTAVLKNADSTSIRNYSGVLYTTKASVKTLAESGLIDSVATTDTLYLGMQVAAKTVDNFYIHTIGTCNMQILIEECDSLEQTAGLDTLMAATAITLSKTTLTPTDAAWGAGKILRIVFPAVTTEPKHFAVVVAGHE